MTFGTGNSLMRHQQLLNCSRNLLLSVGQSQPQQHTAAHKHKQFQNPAIHLHMIILILPCHPYVTIAHFNQQLNTLKPPSHWHTVTVTVTSLSRHCENHTSFIYCYLLCMLYHLPITSTQCTSHTCRHILQCIKSLVAEETTLCLTNGV